MDKKLNQIQFYKEKKIQFHLHCCYGLNVVSLPYLYIETYALNVMVFRGGIWDVSDHEDEALINRISALEKGPQEDHLALLPCEVRVRTAA